MLVTFLKLWLINISLCFPVNIIFWILFRNVAVGIIMEENITPPFIVIEIHSGPDRFLHKTPPLFPDFPSIFSQLPLSLLSQTADWPFVIHSSLPLSIISFDTNSALSIPPPTNVSVCMIVSQQTIVPPRPLLPPTVPSLDGNQGEPQLVPPVHELHTVGPGPPPDPTLMPWPEPLIPVKFIHTASLWFIGKIWNCIFGLAIMLFFKIVASFRSQWGQLMCLNWLTCACSRLLYTINHEGHWSQHLRFYL